VGFDDAFSNCHAEARALGLRRVKRLEDALLLLGRQTGAVVAHRHTYRRFPAQTNLLNAHPNLDGVAARRQRVLKNVAKNLLQPERIDPAVQVRVRTLLAHPRLAALAADGEVGPRLPPHRVEGAGFALQHERGGVVADLLVQLLEVVLGLLDATHQIERLGPVLHFQLEHLQAGLTAGQRVAALVGQAGHHLADGRQPLRLQAPLLGLPAIRDVLADLQHGRPALIVRQPLGAPDHPAARAVLAQHGVLETPHRRARQDAPQRFPHRLAVVLRHKGFTKVAADHCGGAVAGQLRREAVEVEDVVVGAEDDDQAGGGVDQRAEGRLAALLGPRQPPVVGDAQQTGPQGLGVDRLDDVVGRTLAQGRDGALQVGIAGDDQDGRLGS
jgi:hypothetical protein